VFNPYPPTLESGWFTITKNKNYLQIGFYRMQAGSNRGLEPQIEGVLQMVYFSGFSSAAGRNNGRFDLWKKPMNVEHRTSNIE